MGAQDGGFIVREVAVEAVRPLRTLVLGAQGHGAEVCYECDADPSTRHFAALTPGGELVGVATVHREDRLAGYGPYLSPGMRVRGLAVKEGWRGRGVARALLEALHDAGRAQGIRESWGNGRDANLDFFRRHGYREVSDVFEVVGEGRHVVVARDLARLTRAEKARRRPRAASDPEPDPRPAAPPAPPS